MDLGGGQSGLGGAWTDLREFIVAVHWARPGLLWLAFVPVLPLLADWWAAARNRASALCIGRTSAVRGLWTGSARHGFWGRCCFALALASLVLASAGPHWGMGETDGIAVGRDVVLVIDLSRSMLAEDLATPQARWQAARDATLDLVAAARRRGGHRIGIVVFAARSKVLVPLTTDYDHLAQMLDELDANVQPVELRPADESAKSGTRIGAALTLAVLAHDERFPGRQDIILLSDGDDPAGDREWAEGITSARTAGIPVHAVGIGDVVESPWTLKRRGAAEGELISTRLVEEPLRTIAAEARGEYFPARRDPPRLGEFFTTKLESLSNRELTDDAAASLRDRSPGFWLLGLALLLIAWLRRS